MLQDKLHIKCLALNISLSKIDMDTGISQTVNIKTIVFIFVYQIFNKPQNFEEGIKKLHYRQKYRSSRTEVFCKKV